MFIATSDHRTTLEIPLRKDSLFRLDRWPAGDVQVRALRGDWYSEPVVFGAADGEVVADEELQLEVDIDPEAGLRAERFDLELEVIAPAGWALDELNLALELGVSPSGVESRILRAATQLEPADATPPQRFRYERGSQPAGTWVAAFSPSEWRAVVTLDASGRQQLTLPEASAVTVTAVDPVTGAPVQDVRMTGFCALDGPATGWSPERATARPEPGLYEFRAPATEVGVTASHEDYGMTSQTFTLMPGPQTPTLEMAPLVDFALQLLDGDKNATPEGWDWMPEARSSESGEPYGQAPRSVRDGQILYWPQEPGLYTLHFLQLIGYEQIEPLDIDLKPGGIQDIDVQVVAKR